MLSITQMENLIWRVTYKPGWKFKVYMGRHEGPHIQITTVVPDAYDLDKTVTLDVHSQLPPMRSDDQFYEWLLWRIKIIECHEAREFFRVDNVVYDDPHAEFADRDL